jgi:hypothetical protein
MHLKKKTTTNVNSSAQVHPGPTRQVHHGPMYPRQHCEHTYFIVNNKVVCCRSDIEPWNALFQGSFKPTCTRYLEIHLMPKRLNMFNTSPDPWCLAWLWLCPWCSAWLQLCPWCYVWLWLCPWYSVWLWLCPRYWAWLWFVLCVRPG